MALRDNLDTHLEGKKGLKEHFTSSTHTLKMYALDVPITTCRRSNTRRREGGVLMPCITRSRMAIDPRIPKCRDGARGPFNDQADMLASSANRRDVFVESHQG